MGGSWQQGSARGLYRTDVAQEGVVCRRVFSVMFPFNEENLFLEHKIDSPYFHWSELI